MLTSIGRACEVEEKASLVGRASVERVLQVSEQLVLDAADRRKQRAALQSDWCDVRRLDGSSRLRQLHHWSTHRQGCLRALRERHHLADVSVPPPQATRSRRRLSLWPEVERLAQQGQQHEHVVVRAVPRRPSKGWEVDGDFSARR